MASPPAITPPYDTAESILQLARARCNDAGITIDGNLLSDSQPYTLTYLNSAIRDVQEDLADNAVETFSNEVLILKMPVAGSTDPSVFTSIGYDNFFDGVNYFPNPVLPQDLLMPSKLWERQSQIPGGVMIPMYPVTEALPNRPKTGWLREWEWREDRIYFVGAVTQEDVRIRYTRVIPDINNVDNPVPLLRCRSALAWHIAWEFALPRGGAIAPTFIQLYNQEIEEIVLRTTRRRQRVNNRRKSYDRRGYTIY